MGDPSASASPADLFATSWTIHRAAPLYHAKECKTLLDNPAALKVYGSRLRDTLTGDVLRGVQLSGTSTSVMLDEALAKAGALKSCIWRTLPTWSYWNEEQSLLEDPDEEGDGGLVLAPEQLGGIMVVLQYETITYRAALLCGPEGYLDTRADATYLPLLVTRMPNALRQEFVSFLSTSFDTRISVLRLPGSFLCAALENYLATLTRPPGGGTTRLDNNASRDFIQRIIKEAQLTLSFPPPVSPALRSLDVLLSRDSLAAFYYKKRENAPAQSSPQAPSAPFIAALSDYFNAHLAMPLNISALQGTSTNTQEPAYMRLTKVSCNAFVLGGEGRVKFLANPGRAMFLGDDVDEDEDDVEDREKRLVWRANEQLLRALVNRAAGRES